MDEHHHYGFSTEEWQICLKVLTALKDQPEHNPDNLRFSGLISKIYKTHKKQNRDHIHQAKQQHDNHLKKQAKIADLALNNQTLYRDFQPFHIASKKPCFAMPQHCYVCQQQYQHMHAFYHRLCPTCAELNYAMRFQHADLSGRHVILTGGRVKVGFATALKLLQQGAHVCLTTRFPALALQQFQQQADYSVWQERLFVYGLDLRSLNSIEQFIEFYQQKYQTLDILINNAAQTIHYPENYYAPLIQLEQQQAKQLEHHPAWQKNDVAVIPTTAQLPQHTFLQPECQTIARSRFGQPVDTREKNSWNSKLEEIDLKELLEVNLINHIAPYRLIQGLKSCMMASEKSEKWIINITSSEGMFSYHNKTADHPHTNMTKAALNMLTRTTAQDFVKDQIYMCAVDVGWISTGAIEPLRQKQFDKGMIPPLDSVDGASRIMHPIWTALQGEFFVGVLLKDYKVHPW